MSIACAVDITQYGLFPNLIQCPIFTFPSSFYEPCLCTLAAAMLASDLYCDALRTLWYVVANAARISWRSLGADRILGGFSKSEGTIWYARDACQSRGWDMNGNWSSSSARVSSSACESLLLDCSGLLACVLSIHSFSYSTSETERRRVID